LRNHSLVAIALGKRKTLKYQFSKLRDFRGSTGTSASRNHNVSAGSTSEEKSNPQAEIK